MSVVTSTVCGIRLIEKRRPLTRLVVSETPSTTIDPLRAMYFARFFGGVDPSP